jgi:hypothetical protein
MNCVLIHSLHTFTVVCCTFVHRMEMVLVCGYSVCKFKLILQTFLYEISFYSLDEYFELKKDIYLCMM